jgi:glycosyltransferase involved in cell wall biosynthesis
MVGNMKICLIGPGLMSIPPNNWGAVESLIWDYSEYLIKKGHSVDILNTTNLQEVAYCVNNIDYDFIHLQYDDHAPILNRLIKKPFCVTTHFGYVKEQYPFYPHWKHIFDGVMQSPGLICLSPEIQNVFKQSGFNKFNKVLRNGARFDSFDYNSTGNKKAICLGKIEPRKKQSTVANFSNNKASIDFVGPIIDNSFCENNTCKYKGIWTKPDLYKNLTNYSALLLLSDGEAAPLVIPEALCAGLSIIATETAAANLDRTLPFIKVLPNNYSPDVATEAINSACEENDKYREDIRSYAKNVFDWDVICDDYIKIIVEFKNENCLS